MTFFFAIIFLLRIGKKKVEKKKQKNFMIQSNQLKKLKLKQIEKNKNCQYLIGYLDKVIRPFRKMSRYVRNFKNKDRNKEKNENDKLYIFL